MLNLLLRPAQVAPPKPTSANSPASGANAEAVSSSRVFVQDGTDSPPAVHTVVQNPAPQSVQKAEYVAMAAGVMGMPMPRVIDVSEYADDNDDDDAEPAGAPALIALAYPHPEPDAKQRAAANAEKSGGVHHAHVVQDGLASAHKRARVRPMNEETGLEEPDSDELVRG